MSLEDVCRVHGPSGSEWRIKNFLKDYIKRNSGSWKVKPKLITDNIKDNLILVFGKPKNVIFCHYDTTGFTVRYNNKIISIGSPDIRDTDRLRTVDNKGKETVYHVCCDEEKKFGLISKKNVTPGTVLSFAPSYTETRNIVTSPYLDNRAGVWACLELAKTLKNGMIVFTAYEEHGGGSVEFLAPLLYKEYNVSKAIICDMTWQSEYVKSGKGIVVSLRDKYIPRQLYTERICNLLSSEKIKFQTEVEGSGASDGGYLQKCSVPFDWCFTGVALGGMHSSAETLDKRDLNILVDSLKLLCEKL